MRVIVFAHLEFADDALVVKDSHRLLRLQVERMSCIAGLAQRLEEIVKRTDVVKAIADGGESPFLALQRAPDLGVGEACVRVDDGGIELIGLGPALRIDDRIADHRQAIDAGIERTEAVRELLRQHRHDARGEVDARGALLRVNVERRTGLDVVAHVGDGDEKARSAVFDARAVDGVVEVTGILAVDRHERDVAQVDAATHVFGIDFVRQGLSLVKRRSAEFNGQVVFGRGDGDFAERIEAVADLLDEAHEDLDVGLGLHRFGQELDLEGRLLEIDLGGNICKVHLHLDRGEAVDRNDLCDTRTTAAADAAAKLADPARLMTCDEVRNAPVARDRLAKHEDVAGQAMDCVGQGNRNLRIALEHDREVRDLAGAAHDAGFGRRVRIAEIVLFARHEALLVEGHDDGVGLRACPAAGFCKLALCLRVGNVGIEPLKPGTRLGEILVRKGNRFDLRHWRLLLFSHNTSVVHALRQSTANSKKYF